MATALDLQEQEQLDELKAFWKKYGNPITWLITVVLMAFAAWNGWNWYQRDQGAKAAAMFDALDQAAVAGDADKAGRVFNDLKERYPRTVMAQQGGLLAAKLQAEKGQTDAAKATLGWVAENGSEDEYRAIAGLALAGVLLDAKQPDVALKALDAVKAPTFAGLVADRRGDALLALNKPAEAKAAYQAAWKAIDEKIDYRRLVEAKLTALGAAPVAPAADAASGAAK
ncbi:tetratricopeptide repeat protein [Ideonella sp. DXS22W]|uniref:Ancillary SecYEG translocon subunit n=1 Tax=Pseudaquabacterium inlustre TaxID=2984192 RepID=A0ABU9CI15_9BURK